MHNPTDIKNLHVHVLPDNDDTLLLNYAVCYQGSHNDCVLQKLAMLLGHTDGVTGTNQQQNESDPAGLSGFHYLCGACENAIISGYFGLLKKLTI